MFRLWIVILLFILLCHFSSFAFARTIPELALNPAEKYVLKQVEKGTTADLQKQLQKKDRILRATFLKELLTGSLQGLEVTVKSIMIKGARINEKLDVRDTKIPFAFSLELCTFDKDIDFSGTKFAGRADFSNTVFSKRADFFNAQFSGKVIFQAVRFLKEASFPEAEFSSETSFSNAQFSEVNFIEAKFSRRADFSNTVFSDWADFSEVKFSGRTDFSEAKFSEKATFKNADLRGADLRGANLYETNLREADLKDCIVDRKTKLPLVYEPKAGSPPYIPSMAKFPDLRRLSYEKSPHGLVDLREGFKKLGYRQQEREITYAIKHTLRCNLWHNKESSIWNKFESLFYYLFFELTCQYGLKPGRPLLILVGFIFLFTIPYSVFVSRESEDGIWKIWIKERIRKDIGTKEFERLFFKGIPAITKGFYFSLLSAFSIGWREFNVGNWIARIQRREYVLRATGWARVVSGIQSLISLYLMALWVLTYFGRPFEAV